MGECTVGMYLAMSRQADREGCPEIAEAFISLLLKKQNMRPNSQNYWEKLFTPAQSQQSPVEAEHGACRAEDLATRKSSIDAIHDTLKCAKMRPDMEKDLPDYLKDISETNNMIHNDMIQPFYGV